MSDYGGKIFVLPQRPSSLGQLFFSSQKNSGATWTRRVDGTQLGNPCRAIKSINIIDDVTFDLHRSLNCRGKRFFVKLFALEVVYGKEVKKACCP
jgi:hypothetical protein